MLKGNHDYWWNSLSKLKEYIKEKKLTNIDKEIIVCMHYPPTSKDLLENSEFIKIMQKYNVKKCLYGHLHGEAKIDCIEGNIAGIDLKLISADYLNFKLYKVNH